MPSPHRRHRDAILEIEGLLPRSFPDPGDAGEIRALFERFPADDGLGVVGAPRRDGGLHFARPGAVLAAPRPAG